MSQYTFIKATKESPKGKAENYICIQCGLIFLEFLASVCNETFVSDGKI